MDREIENMEALFDLFTGLSVLSSDYSFVPITASIETCSVLCAA